MLKKTDSVCTWSDFNISILFLFWHFIYLFVYHIKYYAIHNICRCLRVTCRM